MKTILTLLAAAAFVVAASANCGSCASGKDKSKDKCSESCKDCKDGCKADKKDKK
ncbi:MAG: hypothetical protein ACK45B_15765 [Limisphaerales bacterium]|jgi:hypothetical protein